MLGQSIRRFLTGEEVPRWFGLSIVLIYLVGLGSVARYGIDQARGQSAEALHQRARYSVDLLAEHLSTLRRTEPSETALIDAMTRVLLSAAVNLPADKSQVVDASGRVIASNLPWLTRSAPGATPDGGESNATSDQPPLVMFRASLATERTPVDRSRGTARETASSIDPSAMQPQWFVEVYLSPQGEGQSGLAGHAGSLVIVLAVLGALFVVYRCLREQLRSVSRIADRLTLHRDQFSNELESLHIADTRDGVTSAWNELIDLTQELTSSVQQSEATRELTKALAQSGSGALADALNALPDGILYVSDGSSLKYANTAAIRFFGWSEEQMQSSTIPEAGSQYSGKVLALLTGACHADGRYQAITQTIERNADSGMHGDAHRVTIVPLHRPHQSGECLVVVRDVSQQVRADKAREDFITQVTHELRTPLTNIRAYTETLASGMFDDPKIISECYNVITKETRRLSRLVEDILSVSQIEVGSIELRIEDVDLKTLLSEGVRDLQGLADEKNIDLQLVMPSKMETIRGDRDKLAVVINNLLGNAVKYTPEAGNIICGCKFEPDAVVLTFKDNGIGIAADDHARIFDKFQRADDEAVRNEPGTGIGLYTAREIVQRHHGDIELISEPGQGSTFLVRLPRQQNRAASLTTNEEVSTDA